MTANVQIHPSSLSRGLENARQIIRSPKGQFEDYIVLDACDFLLGHGTWVDCVEQDKIRKAVAISATRKLEQADDVPPFRGSVIQVMAAAIALVVIWACLFIGMSL